MFVKVRKIKCEICGKTFITESRVQKYCSPECYTISAERSKKAKKTHLKNFRKRK